MRTLFISLMLTGFFFSPIAQADLAPEPENSEPADEDTAESEDTEKSGCSSAGNLDLGISLFPILCLGWLALARNRDEE